MKYYPKCCAAPSPNVPVKTADEIRRAAMMHVWRATHELLVLVQPLDVERLGDIEDAIKHLNGAVFLAKQRKMYLDLPRVDKRD